MLANMWRHKNHTSFGNWACVVFVTVICTVCSNRKILSRSVGKLFRTSKVNGLWKIKILHYMAWVIITIPFETKKHSGLYLEMLKQLHRLKWVMKSFHAERNLDNYYTLIHFIGIGLFKHKTCYFVISLTLAANCSGGGNR